MEILLNTVLADKLEISLLQDGKEIIKKSLEAKLKQAEILLPTIDDLLKEENFKLSDIKKIIVHNEGGTFTSLRIGVVTANALGYALGVPVESAGRKGEKSVKSIKLVAPLYNTQPHITIKEK
jgi:tRNA A37 threonylcarbamoyladenosine modification protein TsaB